VWTPRLRLATPRPLHLRLRIQPPRHLDRKSAEKMIASNLASTLWGSLNADFKRPGFFYSGFSGGAFLPIDDEAVQLVGCDPGVLCDRKRIQIEEPGVFPTVGEVEVKWAH
jgi:hypothetical protein